IMGHRVLILAEAASPDWVSVSLVGWSHARALMEVCAGHLVTQVRNREAVLRAGLVEGEDFTAIDTEVVAKKTIRISNFLRGSKRNSWTIATMMQTIGYPYFEKLVWQKFGRRIRGGEFDVVHRITPLT